MPQMLLHAIWKRHISVYAALVVWGTSGAMAYPSFSSMIYHVAIMPLALAVLIFTARKEGQDRVKQDEYRVDSRRRPPSDGSGAG